MLLNFLATIIIFGGYMISPRISSGITSHLKPQHWFLRGTSIIGLQLLAYSVHAFAIRGTSGYTRTSTLEIVLLSCTLPQIAWLPTILIGIQPIEKVNLTAAASALLSEALLQALSSYHILVTIAYGIQHNFYFYRLTEVDIGGFAQLMY
ncbi:hypothetical protein DE146DRAFT_526357 [Phaeosphaeria sp. MPI-PUGE-AT-0046c]|nr:hypothetical protein DE146DRAFT_526357 [Phaeosphaeria sp. MPI-PUGE-AT-0046c]